MGGLLSGLVLVVALSGWLLAPSSARAKLLAEEIELKVILDARASEMVETLERWVELNTGTWNREGLERFAKLFSASLSELGFAVTIEPGQEIGLPDRAGSRSGPLVVARRPASPNAPEAPRFLLVGHCDTVFEPDSPFQEFRISPEGAGRALGPGVADMKGGLVVMLFALRALAETGALDAAAWTVLLNADEEVGSLASRERIEAEARRANFGFVFEPARPDGAMIRSRRGIGQFRLQVVGVAAHAGNDHARGRSAIRELAEKVLRIEAMTDYTRGVTLNVGTLQGGTKRNIVPDRAEAWVDVRYDDAERGEEIRKQLEQLAAEVFVDGTETRLWGALHRPPKPASEDTLHLLQQYEDVARELGIATPASLHAGAGTDGSLTSAVGLPTLDSIGVRGGKAHTEGEFVVLDSLPERAAIAAILLRRLSGGPLASVPAADP